MNTYNWFSKCNHLSSYSGLDYTDHALFGFACYFLALPLEFGLRPREKEKRKGKSHEEPFYYQKSVSVLTNAVEKRL